MKTTNHSTAVEIASIVAAVKAKEAELTKLKTQLIEAVGDEGEKFETALGVVTVTKRTEDRATGQFGYSLDVAQFKLLDQRVQANLIKQKVITETEKVTKGQAPIVRVTLK